jgi:hypothetical protein
VGVGVVLLLLGGLAASASAQGLRVRVVDDSGAPVVGALVALQRDGRLFAEGLTRHGGLRFFPADPSGRYTALVRIGGRAPYQSDMFGVPSDTSAVTIRVPARRAELPISQAAPDRQECRAIGAGINASVWEQASVALRSAELVNAEPIETLAIRRFERTLDRDGALRSESPLDAKQYGTRPFRPATPQELSRNGFVTTDVVGQPQLLAPDATIFLSPEFQRDHCFGVVRGTDIATGLLGLHFRPVENRRVVDVEGVMWLDGESAELRAIEFSYRGPLPQGARELGGRMSFDHLRSGSWIVRDWSLRAPVATQGGQLLGYREEGGETYVVSRAMLAIADSIQNSRKPPGRINGVVIDSLSRQPLAGATIMVDSSGPRTRSDDLGMFSLRGVAPGWHWVTFRHPLLDSIGTRVIPHQVRVGGDSTTNIVLGGPTLKSLKGGACADSTAILTGVVRDVASNAPVDAAQVTLSWIEIVFIPGQPLQVLPNDLTVETDSSGRYAACVPPQLEITAIAEAGPVRTGRVDVRTEDRRLAILNLTIDRTATDTVLGSAVLSGVVMYQDMTPISGATVLLGDPERTAVSDSSGRFRIASIPGGTRVLDAKAIGHAPARVVTDARPGDSSSVRLFMRKVTTLDAIVVRASAGHGGRAIRELEERRKEGIGYRLTPIELLAFKHARLDAVVRALPFARVRSTPGGTRVMLSGRGGRDCTPSLWIDGQPSTIDLLDAMSASQALAVEIFTRGADVPARYRKSYDECGAILLWTRDGVG